MDATVSASCPARAALAGNPSDGFGGAVVSVPVPRVHATVTASPGTHFEIQPSPSDDDSFTSLDALTRHVDALGYGGARQLVLAALRSMRRHLDADVAPLRLSATTTIPRSVGLAGSSAIVIAAIRAIAATDPESAWARRLDDPALLAAVALDAETTELGIAAGLQDRVVQAMGTPVLMDFADAFDVAPGLSSGRYEPLPEPPGVLFVATLPDSAAPSGIAHRSLRDDVQSNRGPSRHLLDEIAEHGRSAALAIRRGDVAALGAAMDATLDARRSLMVLDPRHVAIGDTARSCGCHANYSGSGGSVTVLAPNGAVADAAREALASDLGCSLIEISGR